ncbi:hypothetical protein VP01_1384g3 [Puccinia sorghi]|uniref:Uncharacterized protein n=1 Tax=Puccinia sorghi TaxID=27349 RepID=A0A0L6VLW7_9BASI|nr:hypothetical protein VP01_1384g3 [Puccinia sorghi]
MRYGDRSELQPSAQQSVQNHNMLYIIKLISSLDYLSKHFDCLIANCFFYLDPSSPKIRLNLCTTYNQHKTGIRSVYDQVQRNNLHASAMETSLVKGMIVFHVSPYCNPVRGLKREVYVKKGLKYFCNLAYCTDSNHMGNCTQQESDRPGHSITVGMTKVWQCFGVKLMTSQLTNKMINQLPSKSCFPPDLVIPTQVMVFFSYLWLATIAFKKSGSKAHSTQWGPINHQMLLFRDKSSDYFLSCVKIQLILVNINCLQLPCYYSLCLLVGLSYKQLPNDVTNMLTNISIEQHIIIAHNRCALNRSCLQLLSYIPACPYFSTLSMLHFLIPCTRKGSKVNVERYLRVVSKITNSSSRKRFKDVQGKVTNKARIGKREKNEASTRAYIGKKESKTSKMEMRVKRGRMSQLGDELICLNVLGFDSKVMRDYCWLRSRSTSMNWGYVED